MKNVKYNFRRLSKLINEGSLCPPMPQPPIFESTYAAVALPVSTPGDFDQATPAPLSLLSIELKTGHLHHPIFDPYDNWPTEQHSMTGRAIPSDASSSISVNPRQSTFWLGPTDEEYQALPDTPEESADKFYRTRLSDSNVGTSYTQILYPPNIEKGRLASPCPCTDSDQTENLSHSPQYSLTDTAVVYKQAIYPCNVNDEFPTPTDVELNQVNEHLQGLPPGSKTNLAYLQSESQPFSTNWQYTAPSIAFPELSPTGSRNAYYQPNYSHMRCIDQDTVPEFDPTTILSTFYNSLINDRKQGTHFYGYHTQGLHEVPVIESPSPLGIGFGYPQQHFEFDLYSKWEVDRPQSAHYTATNSNTRDSTRFSVTWMRDIFDSKRLGSAVLALNPYHFSGIDRMIVPDVRSDMPSSSPSFQEYESSVFQSYESNPTAKRPHLTQLVSKRRPRGDKMQLKKKQEGNDRKMFPCGLSGCVVECTRSGDVLRHRQTKHSVKHPFSCSQCDKCFSRKDKLREHVKKIHKEQIRKKSRGPALPFAIVYNI